MATAKYTETETKTEKKTKTYIRLLRVTMSKEQAEEWDKLDRDDVEEFSALFQEDIIDNLGDFFAKRAERIERERLALEAQIKAQEEILSQIPEEVKSQAIALGLTLNLQPA